MAKKSNLLKNLLTTASAVAVLASGVQGALATDYTTAGDATFETGENNTNTNVNDQDFVDGDQIIFGGAGHTATIANGTTVGATNTGNAPLNAAFAIIIGGGEVSMGSIGGAGAAKLRVNDGSALIFTGVAGNGALNPIAANTYSGVSAITLGQGNGNGLLGFQTVGPTNFAGTINSANGSNGKLAIVSGANNRNTFSGIIGDADQLTHIFVGGSAGDDADGFDGNAVFTQNVKATNVIIGGEGNANGHVGGAGTASFINLKADTIVVGGDGADDAGHGGAGTLTVTGALSNSAGDDAAAITVGAAGGGGAKDGVGIVHFNGTTGKAALTFANYVHAAGVNSVINLNRADFTGKIDAAVAGKGLVNVLEDSTILGKNIVGSTESVGEFNIAAGKKLTLDAINLGATINKITKLTMSQGSTLILKDTNNNNNAHNQTLTLGAAGISLATHSTGTIQLDDTIGNNSNVIIAGKIGTYNIVAADLTRSLGVLNVGAGVASNAAKNVTLTAAGTSQSIDVINFAGASNLLLTGGNYQIGAIRVQNADDIGLRISTGASIVNKGVTNNQFNASLDLGTADKRLKEVRFIDASTLTLGDGVNVYAIALTNTAANAGNLTFLGNSTFDAPIIPAKKINTITGPDFGGGTTSNRALIVGDIGTNANVVGDTGILAFGGSLDAATKNIIVGGGKGVIEFSGNVEAADIRGNVANQGIARFKNNAAITVTSTIGTGNNKVKTLQFSGADVKITGAVVHNNAAQNVVFDSASTTPTVVTLDTDNPDFTAANFSSTAAATPVIQLHKNGDTLALTGNVGSDATHLITLRLDGAGTTNVKTTSATNLQFANITTNTTNKNSFTFNFAGGSRVNSLGAADTVLKTVTFANSGEVIGDAYSNNFAIDDTMIATFNGVVSAGTKAAADAEFVLDGGTAEARFNDGSTIDIAVTSTDRDANGIVTLGSGIRGKVNVNADVQSNVINSGESTLVFRDKLVTNKRKVDGNYTATNTTFDLGDTAVNFEGASTKFVDTITINTQIAITDSQIAGGHIHVQAKTFNTDLLRSVNVNIIDPNFDLPDVDAPLTFTVLDTDVQATSLDKTVNAALVNAQGGSSLAKVSGTMDNKGKIKVIISNDAANVIVKDLTNNAGTAADSLNGAILTESKSVTRELGSITDSAKRAELVKRLPVVETTAVVSDVASRIGDSLVTRMDNLAGLQGTPVTARVVGDAGTTSGMSAGDAEHRYGAWLSPFAAKSTQKARGEASGYKADTYGANIGFDTRANDDMIIGASAAFLTTNVKYKNFKSGDKAKINSMMFSVYGMQQINDNWFAEGVVTFGSNKVKTTEKKVGRGGNYVAVNGDYTSMSYGGQGFFGYSFVAMDNYVITPMIGARYNSVSDSGYTQTGNTAQLLTVSKKATGKFEGILGARVAAGSFDLGMLAVNPEVHGFLTQNMTGKAARSTQKLSDSATPLASKNAPVTKTFYNVGLGLNAEQGAAEYGIGYDLHLAKKFVGHQGTLKLRLNF